MLVASAVLPIEGRPARMTRSEGCRPPSWLSRSASPVARSRKVAVALVGGVRHVDGVGERGAEAEKSLAVLALLGEIVEPRLGLLDLALGRGVDGAVVGTVDHVLADDDERAPRGEIVDGAAVVLGVDDGRGVGGQRAEVLRHGEVRRDRLGRLEERPQRDRRRLLADVDELARRLVDLLVQRIEEMVRLEERGDAIHRLVVDEDGAEQRLLGLKVVRSLPEGERLVGVCRRLEPVGDERRVVCHGADCIRVRCSAVEPSSAVQQFRPRYAHGGRNSLGDPNRASERL